jgi:Meiotically up-regulated gene 113
MKASAYRTSGNARRRSAIRFDVQIRINGKPSFRVLDAETVEEALVEMEGANGKKPIRPLCVYVMETRDAIKVGISENPWARLDAIQGHCPFPVELVYVRKFEHSLWGHHVEGRTQRALGKHRLEGEWFDVDVDAAVRLIEDFADDRGSVVLASGTAASSPSLRTPEAPPRPSPPEPSPEETPPEPAPPSWEDTLYPNPEAGCPGMVERGVRCALCGELHRA